MADVDRCVICGQPIPEGGQVCLTCEKVAGEGTPDIVAVREAAKIIKRYCSSRNSNPETDCVECPIKDICYNEPYLWEV